MTTTEVPSTTARLLKALTVIAEHPIGLLPTMKRVDPAFAYYEAAPDSEITKVLADVLYDLARARREVAEQNARLIDQLGNDAEYGYRHATHDQSMGDYTRAIASLDARRSCLASAVRLAVIAAGTGVGGAEQLLGEAEAVIASLDVRHANLTAEASE